MYDLVLNDDNIFDKNPTFVRLALGDTAIDRLIEILVEAGQQLDNPQFWDTRTYTLLILFRIFQVH